MEQSILNNFHELDGFLLFLHRQIKIEDQYALFHLAHFYPKEYLDNYVNNPLPYFKDYVELDRNKLHENEKKFLELLHHGQILGEKQAECYLGRYYLDYYMDDNLVSLDYLIPPELKTSAVEDSYLAIHYFTNASNRGCGESLFQLGKMHREAIGIPEDPEEFLRLTLLSAVTGNLEAGCTVIYAYHEGYGVEQDDQQARTFLSNFLQMSEETPNEYLALFEKHFALLDYMVSE